MSGNVSDSSGIGESADELLQTPNSRRAKVWEYYEPDLVEVDNVMKVVCKYCSMKLACKSGTSSLRNHIGESCPKIDDESRNRFLATIKKKPSDVGFVFDPQRSRQLMIKFCIHAEVPFRKFEDPYFEEWMESMQPTFKVIRRHTVRNDCYDAYEQMKDQLRIEFESLDSRVCLTSDMWTSVQELGYMCITAHYIDANFNLKKKVISFKKVKYPHTSAAIEETLSKCLTEWGIKRKLFTLTLDNAANNNPAYM